MTNFKGKVTYYKNVNGEEKRFEKEFDDEKEYRDFIRENDLQDDNLTLRDFYEHLLDDVFGEPAFHIPLFHNRNSQNKRLNERKRDGSGRIGNSQNRDVNRPRKRDGSGRSNNVQRKRRKDKSRNKRNQKSNKRKKSRKIEKLKRLRDKIDDIIKQEE